MADSTEGNLDFLNRSDDLEKLENEAIEKSPWYKKRKKQGLLHGSLKEEILIERKKLAEKTKRKNDNKLGLINSKYRDYKRRMTPDGYVLVSIKNHPYSTGGYVREHRLVIEDWLRINDPDNPFLVDVDGIKYLREEYQVHHCNRIKIDNRPENLVVVTQSAHNGIHNPGKIIKLVEEGKMSFSDFRKIFPKK